MSKEIKIGLTGIIALCVLFFGTKLLKGMDIFSSRTSYYIQFKNAKGLSESSAVFADGFNVGIVSDILYDYDHPGKVLIKISINNKLRIPKGSSACIDEGMLGGCTLNMKLTSDVSNSYQPGDTIIGSESEGLMTKAAGIMPEVESVIAKVDTLIGALNVIATNPNLAIILQNVGEMSANLNQSTEELKSLLANDIPQLTSTYNKAGENIVELTDNIKQLDLQTTLDSINRTIQHANNLLTQLQSEEGTLGHLLHDTSLYDNLNHTVQSADSLVTDLKAHPKRYVHFSIFGKKE